MSLTTRTPIWYTKCKECKDEPERIEAMKGAPKVPTKPAIALALLFISAASALMACGVNPVAEKKGVPAVTLSTESVSGDMAAPPGQDPATPAPCNANALLLRFI